MRTDDQIKAQLRADVEEIRRLAALVESPEQFETMMAGIPDPHTQRQVRALLRPLLPFVLPEVHGDPTPDV